MCVCVCVCVCVLHVTGRIDTSGGSRISGEGVQIYKGGFVLLISHNFS